ncbi:MAG: filamentous hemagglutinin N-terminal domain-containing protein, partial [Nitrosopumilus sp.]|nr:filamentous hemagglutinin N-terminal domain-containing protein [Nitrosopumilus sp.]
MHRIRRSRWIAGITVASYVLGLATPVLAIPQDGTVVEGDAHLVYEGTDTLTIHQHTEDLIINWDSFSIDAGEFVNFLQPTSSSFVLNRVIGAAISNINGMLTANGGIGIINPNGILFGGDAIIDVQSILASTIDIADQKFMAGDYNFDILKNPNSTVINKGLITAAEGGLVALVAPGVVNSGVIQATMGKVSLAAGNEFSIDMYGDGLVSLAVGSEVAQAITDPEQNPLQALVTNSGTIKADGGTVLLTAKAAQGVIDNVINMDGIIQAQSVAQVNGEIILMGGDEGIVQVAGTLDASGLDSGETGGTVKVLGDKVGLFDGAAIDASGDAGGGEVLVGGNYQGLGPEPNATATVVASTVTIDADAISEGDGGRVIVWADDVTKFYGGITATGGASGGDGGFAEVSGKEILDFQGLVDLRAVLGEAGTLLLDPYNILINDAGTEAGTTGDPNFVSNALSSIIRTATIETALATANVTITTGAAGAENGKITVSGNIDAPNTAFNLTLTAHQNLLVDNPINMAANGGTGTLTLVADSDGNETGNINLRTTAADLTTNGTAITLTGANFFGVAGALVDSNGGNITIAASNPAEGIKVVAGSGDILTNVFDIYESVLDGISADGGNLTIGGATQTGNFLTGTAISYAGTSNSIIIETGGTINLTATVNTGGTDLTLRGEDISVSNTITATGATVTIEPQDAGDTVVLGTNPGSANSIELTDTELDRITATTLIVGSTTSGAATITADISPANITNLHIKSNSTITGADATGGITVTNLALTAAGTINFTDTTTQITTLAVSAAGQTVTFTDNTSTTIGTVDGVVGISAGTLTLNTDDRIAVTQNITTNVGNLALDGDADATATTNDDITFTAGLTITSAGSLTLASRAGTTITGAGALTLNAVGGLTLNNSLTTAGATIIDVDTDNNGVGDFAIADTFTLSAGNNAITITANDINLNTSGAINSGTATTTLLVSDGGTIDLGTATGGMNLSAAEINNVTAGVLKIGDATAGAITINAAIAPTGTDTLHLHSGGNVTDGASGYIVETNLAVQGITVTLDHASFDVTTIAVAGGGGATTTITESNGFTLGDVNGLTSSYIWVGTLTATTGNLTIDHALGSARSITLQTAAAEALLTINGGLNTWASGGNYGIILISDKMDINAVVQPKIDKNHTLTVKSTTAGTAINFGNVDTNNTANTLELSATELGFLRGQYVIIGDANAGAITVSSTATLAGTVSNRLITGSTLTATAGSGGGIIIPTARLGIVAAGAVTVTHADTNTGVIAIYTSTGDITYTNTDLIQVHWATQWNGGVVVSGIDTDNGAVNLTATTGNIIVYDVGKADDLAATGNITLTTLANEATVTVNASADVETSAGDIIITADDINIGGTLTASAGTNQTVTLAPETAIDVDTINLGTDGATANVFELTDADLDSVTTDTIVIGTTASGAMTATASITRASATALTLNTVGMFTINDAISLASNNGAITVSADDITITGTGTLSSGTASTTLKVTDGGTIGLGATAGNFTLSGAELQQITATGLTLGDTNTALITVNGISAANSNNISGTVTLNATKNDGDMTFATAASTFNALTVNADDTITVNVDVTTDVGNLVLQADVDSTGDSQLDKIIFADGVTLTTAGGLTLTAPTGGLQALGAVTFSAAAGLTLGDLTLTGATTLNADNDNNGTGTYTQSGGTTLSTTNSALTIIAADIDLAGSLNSGTAKTTLQVTNGGTIDLGGTGGAMDISAAEVSNVTASALVIGSGTAGAITVSADITPANTTTLHLISGSTITGTAGGIIETNLAMTAGGAVNFADVSTAVDTLAIYTSTGNIAFTNANGFSVTTVDGVTG